ncbi:MAG: tyrosine-type recombinase/integrase, partial [Sneathiella sp.]
PTFNLFPTEIKVDRAVERASHRISVTKTRAGCRWIDISPDIFEMVNYYANHHGVVNKYDLVFPTSTGKWQDITNWRNRGFGALCEAAGLMVEEEKNGICKPRPKFAPYDLRHFYASMLIEQKVSLKRIQTLMGHSNIATTLNVYGHLIERSEQSSERRSGLISSLD